LRAVKKEVYPTIQITTDGTSIFCRKKIWEKVDGTRLLSGAVHTRVEVHRIDSEMSGLMEQP